MALAADESFATVAEADTYAAARGWTDWAAAGTPAKEAALRNGTAYVTVAARWPGELADYDQLLAWPRLYAYDREGRYLEGIPTAVKSATIEAARLALTTSLMAGTGARVTKRVKAGPVEVEYADTSPASLRNDRLTYIHALLRSIGATIAGGTMVALSKS
jgi:hypothetical protein